MKTTFILILVFSSQRAKAFLDIEELKTFNYGIDIRSEPVVISPEVCNDLFGKNRSVTVPVSENSWLAYSIFSATVYLKSQ